MKNQNNISRTNLKPTVMFVDMNSFFASCEQQVNYWLRERPMGVCVYTGQQGAVIALSRTAKKMGLKPARVSDLIQQCPDFIPVETNPNRYRDFHKRIIKVLRHFSDDVIPLSIDEAVINFSSYQLVYKDMTKLAKDIKQKIKEDVGDYLTCSIGIAPNEFLAKLGTELQKPDGLVMITPENIDDVLDTLALTDLPGISKKMAARLVMAGVTSPVQLRHTPPVLLKRACKSIVGEFWYYRLNFMEVDMREDKKYQTMQAMRQVSAEQRASTDTLQDILYALCLQLEKRLMVQEVFCHTLGFSCRYVSGLHYSDQVRTHLPLQGGSDMLRIILEQIHLFEQKLQGERVINNNISSMMVWVTDFVADGLQQYSMFENTQRQDKLRKAVYNIRDRFGFEKIQPAAGLVDKPVMKDVIGFGSIKDLGRGVKDND